MPCRRRRRRVRARRAVAELTDLIVNCEFVTVYLAADGNELCCYLLRYLRRHQGDGEERAVAVGAEGRRGEQEGRGPVAQHMAAP